MEMFSPFPFSLFTLKPGVEWKSMNWKLTSATAIASSSLTPCSLSSRTRWPKTRAGGGLKPTNLSKNKTKYQLMFDLTLSTFNTISNCYKVKIILKNFKRSQRSCLDTGYMEHLIKCSCKIEKKLMQYEKWNEHAWSQALTWSITALFDNHSIQTIVHRYVLQHVRQRIPSDDTKLAKTLKRTTQTEFNLSWLIWSNTQDTTNPTASHTNPTPRIPTKKHKTKQNKNAQTYHLFHQLSDWNS